MERTYKFKNGTIVVTVPKSCEREELKKATEEFLKNVMKEVNKNGYSNTRTNFRKK